MKKLLILIAVFASLLTCFFACSDNVGEEIPGVGPDFGSMYDITGFLSFDDNANKYVLYIHDVYITAGKDTYLLDSIRKKDKVYIDPRSTEFEDHLEEFVGSEITTTLTNFDVNYFILHGMLPLGVRINAATVESAQRLLADDTPEIFPEAYTTVPLSRATYNMSGHYEISG